MSKQRKKPFYTKFFPPSYENMLESYLVQLTKLEANQLSFYNDYHKYLADEREKRIDRLNDALFFSRSGKFSATTHRIVKSLYATNPLSTKGSMKFIGGRFNFGEEIRSSLISFPCLYLASSYKTAFAEVYGGSKNSNLTPEELSLENPSSFLHCRVKVELENILDLRENKSIKYFVEIISEIEPSEDLKTRAKSLKLENLNTIKDIDQIKRSLFEENYKQWGAMLNQPSNSQWFGHYARLAGIHALLYPPTKKSCEYNLAVFIENFKNSDSKIELIDGVTGIPEHFKILDRNTLEMFLDNKSSLDPH